MQRGACGHLMNPLNFILFPKTSKHHQFRLFQSWNNSINISYTFNHLIAGYINKTIIPFKLLALRLKIIMRPLCFSLSETVSHKNVHFHGST